MFKKMIMVYVAIMCTIACCGCKGAKVESNEEYQGTYISQSLFDSMTMEPLHCHSIEVGYSVVDIDPQRMPKSGKVYFTLYEYTKVKDKWKQTDCMLSFSQTPQELDKAFTDLVES